jgi:phosphoenolpyruvate carboxykinase (ATP)
MSKQREGGTQAAGFDLGYLGIADSSRVRWNLREPVLYEKILSRGEGELAHMGPVIVNTGKHTARAPDDKFVVAERSTENDIWWGEYNRPFPAQKFSGLRSRVQAYLQRRDVFVQDCYAGADPEYRLPIRVITEDAWQSLFARNMFICSDDPEELRRHIPEFTVVAVPEFLADPRIDGCRTTTAIVINFAERLALICASAYGGEIKKTVFTVLNFLLPARGVMPMHCSANVGPEGDVALFFGLSGTGKTSLSADPRRSLIGDDEHGWSDTGVFNFESGCYAKVIRLSAEHEPQIYAATRRFGTILENVVYDPATRQLDLDDDAITENTRASYPLSFIENAMPEKMARSHPKNIIFLTCDASGVMPPIARLTPEQALYHFISGYTSKIAGTEIGLGREPQITFSTCFGAPFMVRRPFEYAEMLRGRITKHGVNCWVVNTGWVGGSFGVGHRISIAHTRNLLNAALDGSLLTVEYRTDRLFGFEVPLSCRGVPTEVLDPSESWSDKEEYWRKYDALAARFIENFKLFAADAPSDVAQAGPRRLSQVEV